MLPVQNHWHYCKLDYVWCSVTINLKYSRIYSVFYKFLYVIHRLVYTIFVRATGQVPVFHTSQNEADEALGMLR